MAQQDHRYNNPDLSPLDFLLAVMHDVTVPLHHRMAAADAAMPYQPTYPKLIPPGARYADEVHYVYRIGGLGDEPASTWPLNHGPEP